eukprot:13255888-Alexandrium_andersonii.AAC.1
MHCHVLTSGAPPALDITAMSMAPRRSERQAHHANPPRTTPPFNASRVVHAAPTAPTVALHIALGAFLIAFSRVPTIETLDANKKSGGYD